MGAHSVVLGHEELERHERGVELGCVPRCECRGLRGPAAADDDGQRLLGRLGQCRRIDHRVRGAAVGEGVADGGVEQAVDDGELVGEHVEPGAERWEVEAVRGVFEFEPTCPEPEFHAATAHLVDASDADGQQARPAERDR